MDKMNKGEYVAPIFRDEQLNNGGRKWTKTFPKSETKVILEYLIDEKNRSYIIVYKFMPDDTITNEEVFESSTEGTIEAVDYFNEMADLQDMKDNPPPPPPPPPNPPTPPPPPPPQDEENFYLLIFDNNDNLDLQEYKMNTASHTISYVKDDVFMVAERMGKDFEGTMESIGQKGSLTPYPDMDDSGKKAYKFAPKGDTEPPKEETVTVYRLKERNGKNVKFKKYSINKKTKVEEYLGEVDFIITEESGDDFKGKFVEDMPKLEMGDIINSDEDARAMRVSKYDSAEGKAYIIVGEGGDNPPPRPPDDDHHKPKHHDKPKHHGKPKHHDEPHLHRTPPDDTHIHINPPIQPTDEEPNTVIEAIEDLLNINKGELRKFYRTEAKLISTLNSGIVNNAEIESIGTRFNLGTNRNEIMANIRVELKKFYNR